MAKPKTIRKSARGKRPTQRRPTATPTGKAPRTATKTRTAGAARPGTKQAALVALLERSTGATIAQLCAKTGWQAHSVRAALTGLRKRGKAVTRTKSVSGTTIYRIEAA